MSPTCRPPGPTRRRHTLLLAVDRARSLMQNLRLQSPEGPVHLVRGGRDEPEAVLRFRLSVVFAVLAGRRRAGPGGARCGSLCGDGRRARLSRQRRPGQGPRGRPGPGDLAQPAGCDDPQRHDLRPGAGRRLLPRFRHPLRSRRTAPARPGHAPAGQAPAPARPAGQPGPVPGGHLHQPARHNGAERDDAAPQRREPAHDAGRLAPCPRHGMGREQRR